MSAPQAPRLLLPLLALSLAACGQGPGGPPQFPPAPVQVMRAEPRTLPRTVTAVGSLESPQMTTVASEIDGRVESLALPEGQQVLAGTVLARLDTKTAAAALAVAQARLQNAGDRFARLEPLRAQGVASQQAVDDARSEFDAATGAHDELATRLAKHTIRAPFGGTVGLKQVNVGQFVKAGDPIVEITPAHALELHFAVPQQHVAALAVGQRVEGMVGRCEIRFEGAVTAVDPRVDPRTRMVGLRAGVTKSSGELVPGMAVRVRLIVAELANAIVLPQEAIVRQGSKHIVYTLNAKNEAEPREVALGEFFVDGVHVTSGIAAGETIVVAGQQKLRPGAAAAPSPWTPIVNPNVEVGRYGPADCEVE
ncbi:MAG TPA: efflux RND transporter periplasmic adaptor subunit [Myxococcota bacterium]